MDIARTIDDWLKDGNLVITDNSVVENQSS